MKAAISDLSQYRKLTWIIVFAMILLIDKVVGQVITVTATSSTFPFGAMVRSQTKSIAWDNASSARFTVTGNKNRAVTLTVTRSAMTTTNGSGAAALRTMTPSLTTSTCRYSRNGGTSWSTFTTLTSGVVSVSTTFPNGSGQQQQILVRVGGSVTTGSRQQRGTYGGTITLTAAYDN
jgi:hypothetical protein